MDWNVQRASLRFWFMPIKKTSCLWYCLKRDAAFQKLFLLLRQISATNEALQVLNDASEDLSKAPKDLVELLKPFGKVHT